MRILSEISEEWVSFFQPSTVLTSTLTYGWKLVHGSYSHTKCIVGDQAANQEFDFTRERAWSFTVIPSSKQSFFHTWYFKRYIISLLVFISFSYDPVSGWSHFHCHLVPTWLVWGQSYRHSSAHDKPKWSPDRQGLQGCRAYAHRILLPQRCAPSTGRALPRWGSHQSVTVSEAVTETWSCQHMQFLLLLFLFSPLMCILKEG